MKWKGISFNFSLNQIIHHLDCDCFVSCMFSLFRRKFSFAFYQCNNQQINPTHSSSFHFCPIFSLHSFDEWNVWMKLESNKSATIIAAWNLASDSQSEYLKPERLFKQSKQIERNFYQIFSFLDSMLAYCVLREIRWCFSFFSSRLSLLLLLLLFSLHLCF